MRPTNAPTIINTAFINAPSNTTLKPSFSLKIESAYLLGALIKL